MKSTPAYYAKCGDLVSSWIFIVDITKIFETGLPGDVQVGDGEEFHFELHEGMSKKIGARRLRSLEFKQNDAPRLRGMIKSYNFRRN